MIGDDDGSVRQISAMSEQLWERFDKTPPEDQRELALRINQQLIELAGSFSKAAEDRRA